MTSSRRKLQTSHISSNSIQNKECQCTVFYYPSSIFVHLLFEQSLFLIYFNFLSVTFEKRVLLYILIANRKVILRSQCRARELKQTKILMITTVIIGFIKAALQSGFALLYYLYSINKKYLSKNQHL